jgi:peptidoglycan hydrolase CwlO-like protein
MRGFYKIRQNITKRYVIISQRGNYIMKKIILLTVIILFAVANLCYAHSGRTDKYGGHYNRSTGTYHYHSGQYAHTGEYSKPIEEGGKSLSEDTDEEAIDEEESTNTLIVDDTDTINRLNGKIDSLQLQIENKEERIKELNKEIEEKDSKIEKLKSDNTATWVICGFIFAIGIYVSYQIGLNKE